MRLAEAGKLADRTERLKQVDRMLKDPKNDAFVRNFAGQWLYLRDVGTRIHLHPTCTRSTIVTLRFGRQGKRGVLPRLFW